VGGDCDGVGVPVGDDDVLPDDVGAGDELGMAVPDFPPGEGATTDGVDVGAAVCRETPCACRALDAGRGLRELCGEVLVVRLEAGAWTWPAIGSLLALDGA
jgi:hypothetical protein